MKTKDLTTHKTCQYVTSVAETRSYGRGDRSTLKKNNVHQISNFSGT